VLYGFDVSLLSLMPHTGCQYEAEYLALSVIRPTNNMRINLSSVSAAITGTHATETRDARSDVIDNAATINILPITSAAAAAAAAERSF